MSDNEKWTVSDDRCKLRKRVCFVMGANMATQYLVLASFVFEKVTTVKGKRMKAQLWLKRRGRKKKRSIKRGKTKHIYWSMSKASNFYEQSHMSSKKAWPAPWTSTFQTRATQGPTVLGNSWGCTCSLCCAVQCKMLLPCSWTGSLYM